MLPLSSLWLPIVAATALVFIASAAVWMMGPHHRGDIRQLSAEARVSEALGAELAPGVYRLPWSSGAEARSPEFADRMRRGPVAMITVARPGPMNMARPMALTALWYLAINILVAAIAAWTMGVMTVPRDIFLVTGTAAFLAHGAADGVNAIWWSKPWSHVAKHVVDSAIYGALTGAAFMWLWP